MRKVEEQMLRLMERRATGNAGSNTTVFTDEGVTRVYLHGNKIAELDAQGRVYISDAGWQTVTTKSRLNAIINYFLDGTKVGVTQSDYEWFVYDHAQITYMKEGQWYKLQPRFTHSDVELPRITKKTLRLIKEAA